MGKYPPDTGIDMDILDISKVTISCTKSDCPGGTSLYQARCEICQTPLMKRYLRILPQPGSAPLQPQTLVGDRYWVTDFADVVLDTQPHARPVVVEDLPPDIQSYLKLSVHMLHCPRVFGLTAPGGAWLLEYPSVSLDPSGLPVHPDLFTSVLEAWKSAEPLQQLNWLAQIAALLPDCLAQGAAGTFYDWSLLGINGGVIQIRQLFFDHKQHFDFPKLAQVWQGLLETTDKSIRAFCHRLYQALSQGKIQQPELLYAVLMAGIGELGRSHYQYQYSIYTQTDAGPSRKHNEDACFPETGKIHHNFPLAIVCDGIGGHDKGEVASAIAIETVQQQLCGNPSEDFLQLDTDRLVEAVLQANDAITNRNDQEQRRERERMGTTLVMAFFKPPHMYLSHVGDSRIYRITPDSCHQVTFDDDLGSREVRLGYALYQDALSYPSAGALIQALGMNSSQSIHPTAQLFTPDADCIYLLCSDGLSDYNRIEQYWQAEILPLLKGEADIQYVGQRLIDVANIANGHDNATIAVFHVQLKRLGHGAAIAFPDLTKFYLEAKSPNKPHNTTSTTSNTNTNAKDKVTTPVTQASSLPRRKQTNWLLLLLGLMGVGAIGLLSWEMWRRTVASDPQVTMPPVDPKPIIETTTPEIKIPDSTNPGETEPNPLTKNQILRLRANAPLNAFDIPEATEPTLWIPGGTLLRIQEINAKDQILLEVCQLGSQTPPTTLSSAFQQIAVGNRGWSSVKNVVAQQEPGLTITSELEALCTGGEPGDTTNGTTNDAVTNDVTTDDATTNDATTTEPPDLAN